MKLESLRRRILAQAKRRGPSFLDLAEALLTLKSEHPGEFRGIIEEAGLKLRRAYYLADVAGRLEPFMAHRSRLEEIGWTKLTIIAKHLTEENAEALLKQAEENTAHRLSALMRDGAPDTGVRTILLHLNPEEYERYAVAILQHGGARTGRGLRDQEKALMQLISKAAPSERGSDVG